MTNEEVKNLKKGDVVLFEYDELEDPVKAQVIVEETTYEDEECTVLRCETGFFNQTKCEDIKYTKPGIGTVIILRISQDVANKLGILDKNTYSSVFMVQKQNGCVSFYRHNLSLNDLHYDSCLIAVPKKYYSCIKPLTV